MKKRHFCIGFLSGFMTWIALAIGMNRWLVKQTVDDVEYYTAIFDGVKLFGKYFGGKRS